MPKIVSLSPAMEAAAGLTPNVSLDEARDILRAVGGGQDVSLHEFRVGVGVEQEHTDDLHEAGKIALDHLREFPDYYTRLTKMEARAKKGLPPNPSGPVIDNKDGIGSTPNKPNAGRSPKKSGEPEMFYHGTTAEEVERFRDGEYEADELYVTNDRETAWLYANERHWYHGAASEPVVLHLRGSTLRRLGRLQPGEPWGDTGAMWQWVYDGPLRRAIVRIERRSGDDLKPNGKSAMPKSRRIFDECFDVVEERFPDFGECELHHDERAAADNGAGSERQFGYCMDGTPIVIAFAAKIEKLPDANIRGLMRHEFGHALDFRYGRRALEKTLGVKLSPMTERRADQIAEAVFGEPIEYDERLIQCIDCGGVSPRPRRLPK